MPILSTLLQAQDADYRAFTCKLIPTLDAACILGVRMPHIHALARRCAHEAETAEFLRTLPHVYHEENMLHAALLRRMQGYTPTLQAVQQFLPHVNNWAVCDLLVPQALLQNPAALWAEIPTWLTHPHAYSVRFALSMLMHGYLTAHFTPDVLHMAATVQHEDYYVHMMQAWLFATALAVRHGETLPYLQEKRLPQAVHRKAIQKAIDSRRITPAQKEYLRTLRDA